jgi:RNA recognition motif-containing protein
MNIYVGNLSYSVTDSELQEKFETFGEVSSARIIMDRSTGNSKGFGFVEMADDSAARNAIEELNKTDFGGRNIIVNEARPRPERGEGGDRRRSGGGGGGDRRRSW